jgi:hypothetical protein
MKSKNAKILVIVAALLVAVLSVWIWQSGGSRAAREERTNQERMQQTLPPPNESAPRSAGPESSPR